MSADNFVVVRKKDDGYYYGNFSASYWWTEEKKNVPYPDGDFTYGPFETEEQAYVDAEFEIGVIEYGFEDDKTTPSVVVNDGPFPNSKAFNELADMARAYEYYEDCYTGEGAFVDKRPSPEALCKIIQDMCLAAQRLLSEHIAMYRALHTVKTTVNSVVNHND